VLELSTKSYQRLQLIGNSLFGSGVRARTSCHGSANLILGVSSTTGVRCLCWEVRVC
jgi:hypothetical protein